MLHLIGQPEPPKGEKCCVPRGIGAKRVVAELARSLKPENKLTKITINQNTSENQAMIHIYTGRSENPGRRVAGEIAALKNGTIPCGGANNIPVKTRTTFNNHGTGVRVMETDTLDTWCTAHFPTVQQSR